MFSQYITDLSDKEFEGNIKAVIVSVPRLYHQFEASDHWTQTHFFQPAANPQKFYVVKYLSWTTCSQELSSLIFYQFQIFIF